MKVNLMSESEQKPKLPYLTDEVIAKMKEQKFIPEDFEFDDITDLNAKIYSRIMNINCSHCKKRLRIDPRERDTLNALFNFILGYSTNKYGHMKKNGNKD